MKKLLVLISGLLFTLTATSFAGNSAPKPEPVKAKSAACCECKCGDKCSPNTPCVEGCDCCCSN